MKFILKLSFFLWYQHIAYWSLCVDDKMVNETYEKMLDPIQESNPGPSCKRQEVFASKVRNKKKTKNIERLLSKIIEKRRIKK